MANALGNVGNAGGATAGITLAALCLFMMSFSLGVGPVTWVVTSEIFPLRVRSKGVAFSMAANRITSGLTPGVTLHFADPEFGVAPGQAAVIYAGERVIGGGWIEATERVAA